MSDGSLSLRWDLCWPAWELFRVLQSVARLGQDDLLDLPVSILLSDGQWRHPLPGRVEVQELAGEQGGHTEPVT